MLTIGTLSLPSKIMLAPMAGVTDLPYRLINRAHGCRCAVTEMISAKALTYRNKKTFEMVDPCEDDRPRGLQLFGSDEDVLKSGIELLSPDSYDFIDLNAACPVNKVVQSGEGSALMRDIPKLCRLLTVMVKTCPKPVTVKIRAGWSPTTVNAVEVAKAAEGCGVKAVFIHGRTRDQFYAGTVDRRVIAAVKKAIGIPVIASGDIFTPQDVKNAIDETACDGVLIARGSYGNPWIFRDTEHFLCTGESLPLPSSQDVAAVMRTHLDLMCEQYDESHGVVLFRKVFVWYTRGFSGIKEMRKSGFMLSDKATMLALIDAFERSADRHEGF